MTRERGLKLIYSKQETTSEIDEKALHDHIINSLELSQEKSPLKLICSVACEFEDKLDYQHKSKIIGNNRVFKKHIKKGELTGKSLTSCIYYIFDNSSSSKTIEKQITKLFNHLKVTFGKHLFIEMNTILKDCTRLKIKQEKKIERTETKSGITYQRKFPNDWSISINADWEIETLKIDQLPKPTTKNIDTTRASETNKKEETPENESKKTTTDRGFSETIISEKKDNWNKQLLLFKITNPILLKKVLSVNSSKNIGKYVNEKSEFFKTYFNNLNLPITSNKNHINKAFNINNSFSQDVFNAFLTCILHKKTISQKQISRSSKDFQNFNSCIEFPKESIKEDVLKRYYSLFKRIHNDDSSIPELKINSNWKVSIKQNKVVQWIEGKKKIAVLVFIILLASSIFIFKPPFIFKDFSDNKSSIYLYEETMYCMFNPNEEKHQILILPFKNIDGKDWKKDKGFIIYGRLKELSEKDSLNFDIKFCHKLLSEVYDESDYKRIMEEYNANHIIYGFVDCASNSNSNEDELCLNYITDLKLPEVLKTKSIYTNYNQFEKASNRELRKGKLQEELDYLVYWNALVGAFNNKKYRKVIQYAKKLEKYPVKDNIPLDFYIGFAYHSLYKIELALHYYQKVIKNSKKIIEEDHLGYILNTHLNIGEIYLSLRNFKASEYYLSRALKIKPTKKNYKTVFKLTRKFKKYNENLELMKLAVNVFKDDYLLKYYYAISKKDVGMTEEFERDSLKIINELNPKQRRSLFEGEDVFFNIRAKTIIVNGALGATENGLFNRLRKDIDGKRTRNRDSIFKDYLRLKSFFPNYFFDSNRGFSFFYKGKKYIEGSFLEKDMKLHKYNTKIDTILKLPEVLNLDE